MIGPENIDRIETNLQIAHASQLMAREFRIDDPPKVFDYDAEREDLRGSAAREPDRSRSTHGKRNSGSEFRAWLRSRAFPLVHWGNVPDPRTSRDRAHRRNADRPFRLGNRSRPSAVQAEGRSRYSDQTTSWRLGNGGARGVSLQNFARSRASSAGSTTSPAPAAIKPAASAGFISRRRLDGGLSFQFDGGTGLAAFLRRPDPPPRYSDLDPRRRARGLFARLFRAAATARQSRTAGTEYDDGRAAHCYGRRASAADNDRSFASWSCARGLACQVLSEASRMGMCFCGQALMLFFGSIGSWPPLPWPRGFGRAKRAPRHEDLIPTAAAIYSLRHPESSD